MKLFYMPGACSLAPHIALCEAGLPFDLVQVDRSKKTSTGEDYLTINVKGAVPAVKLDDGQVLTEAAVIQQYIADKAPAKKLAPAAGTPERYRLQEWLNYIASELHKGIGQLFNPAMPDDYRDTVKKGLAAKQFAHLEKSLAGREYLLGDFTVADGYLFTVLNWTKFHKIDLSAFPNITAFMTRVAARPAVKAAMTAEGLLKAA
ncbi:glutathione transferase GstA [Rhodoplanes sp. Z2-YC6860]|uniref:glutathione transferase GstA n=1 Tax=Rhodoplanes sp. Z2-YC6860 TaxID=674703 RepID=UPI00078BE69B|nr:glutathione transferase GstA [Rhodoplanes sp. Z2-YC6860]AMN44819.1 glutathionine S-transferase [Rhodoplanes sp. Z2-YC6860]